MTPIGNQRADDGETLDALAALARGGDAVSWGEVARRTREPLRGFLRARLPSNIDADDVVQETLVRAHENLDRYDPDRPFKTWLYTIGKNLAINHIDAANRRASLHQRAAAATATRMPPGPDLDVWRTAHRLLPQEQYRALWLRYADGSSIKEIARELRRTVASTKVLLFRARKRLLSEIEQ